MLSNPFTLDVGNLEHQIFFSHTFKYHVSPLSCAYHIQTFFGKANCQVSNENICFHVMYPDILGEHKIE